MKHFNPEKSALAKHAVELERRINWSKTQIVVFENDFRKKTLNHFSLFPHPTSLTKRDLFPKIYKVRLAIINLVRDCIFLIRFDSTRRTVCFLLLLFCSTLLSVLHFLLCLFNVVISVITTSSNHARSVNLTALLFESPFAPWLKPTVSGLKGQCRFQSFTTVEQRLLLLLSCWLVLQHVSRQSCCPPMSNPSTCPWTALHSLMVLDDETIEWLLNTCREI